MEDKKEIKALDAMSRLAEVINDTPTVIRIADEDYYITGLKIGTQILIAEETCRIQKSENGNMIDLYKQFALSVPSVIRCLAYAVLNDKDRIFSDYRKREYSDEYRDLCEKLEWESDNKKWIEILVSVISKINVDFFIYTSEQMTILRDMVLKKRTNGQS